MARCLHQNVRMLSGSLRWTENSPGGWHRHALFFQASLLLRGQGQGGAWPRGRSLRSGWVQHREGPWACLLLAPRSLPVLCGHPPLGPRPLIEGSSKAHASFSLFVICHIYWLSPPPRGLVESRPHSWVWLLAAGGCELCLQRAGHRLAELAQPEQQRQAGIKCTCTAAGPRLPAHLGGAHLGLQAACLQQSPAGCL